MVLFNSRWLLYGSLWWQIKSRTITHRKNDEKVNSTLKETSLKRMKLIMNVIGHDCHSPNILLICPPIMYDNVSFWSWAPQLPNAVGIAHLTQYHQVHENRAQYLKGPRDPHCCFQLSWMIRPLLIWLFTPVLFLQWQKKAYLYMTHHQV